MEIDPRQTRVLPLTTNADAKADQALPLPGPFGFLFPLGHGAVDVRRCSSIGALHLLLAFLLAAPANAQTLFCPEPLVFGGVIPSGVAGTVTVRPNNSRVTTGGVSVDGRPFGNARCILQQPFPFQTVHISVAAPASINNGTVSLSINSFSVAATGNGPSFTTAAGFATIPIGATLNVTPSPAAGAYTGAFTIYANYL